MKLITLLIVTYYQPVAEVVSDSSGMTSGQGGKKAGVGMETAKNLPDPPETRR